MVTLVMGQLGFILKVFFFFLLISKSWSLIHQSCCCYFEKDAFRGFTLKKAQILETTYYQFSEKDDISSQFIELCQGGKTGFSTYENINRLKMNVHIVDQDSCDKECYNLIKDVTESFISKQELNRDHAASRLREKKLKFEKDLDKKINENVDNLFHCQKTTNYIKYTNKKKGHSRGSSVVSVATGFAPKQNTGTLPKLSRKSSISSNIPQKNNNNLDMSFTSFSSTTSELKKGPTMGKEKKLTPEEENNYDRHLNIDQLDKLNLQDGVEIRRIIDRLELEINYMKKKNTKPLDFIMNRFSIQDEILIKIIKIFEATLDEVINQQLNYLTESAYFQFRLLEKLKIKELGFNVVQNKKF